MNFFWGIPVGMVLALGLAYWGSANALDSNQQNKSHCAPGVQGRCIELTQPPLHDWMDFDNWCVEHGGVFWKKFNRVSCEWDLR